MMRRHRSSASKNRLEREVILSVVTLYVIICAGMLTVHFAQR